VLPRSCFSGERAAQPHLLQQRIQKSLPDVSNCFSYMLNELELP